MPRKKKSEEPRLTRTVGYIRMSTDGQDIEKNKSAILLYANDKQFGTVEFVTETASGSIHWRKRKIAELIESLQSGDRLITPEISRLGRSLLEIMEMLSILKSKQVAVYDLKNNWELNGSLQSEVFVFALSVASQVERELISKRTSEALQIKKSSGVRLGRPTGPGKSKLDPYKPEIIALLKNGSSKTFIAKRYGCSLPNLHNWLKKNGIKIEQDFGESK
ncbi:MAG: DNA-invertase hin [Syntrophus sp. PtaB.Bin001]|nr:MAG: DNA-invertase hin [Syntrophus sp. PtaB.Bin001]